MLLKIERYRALSPNQKRAYRAEKARGLTAEKALLQVEKAAKVI